MGNIGFREILLILLVVLIVFGGRRLPELGRGLGRGLRDFRKALHDDGSPDDPDGPKKPDGPKA
ncbi:MAG: twin-arginine translocase TatA/TatE family subunit [Deltaproteobacteria bacterium]|jgi:sec-independent protein translocase protein TatA|nr:twin-arginine translocase TatA/TatE family subunit [Deltaproteobacteria bacterium]MDR1309917.1 twin-arginine translocase TatA/TatE family subunit [Deltaproteobacteria bacterium]